MPIIKHYEKLDLVKTIPATDTPDKVGYLLYLYLHSLIPGYVIRILQRVNTKQINRMHEKKRMYNQRVIYLEHARNVRSACFHNYRGNGGRLQKVS